MKFFKKVGDELNKERSIDVSVDKTLKSMKSGYKVIPSMEIKTWKAYLVVTFVAGFAAALIWSAYMSMYPISKATENEQVTLFTYAASATHKSGEDFSLPIFLDTAGRDIVAVQVVFNYDKNTLEFLSSDISNSGFNYEVKNSVDANSGQGYIDLSKPTPGVKGAAIIIATLNFRAISDVSEPTVALKFDSSAAVSDSAAISDDGQGTNVLQKVESRMVNVAPGPPPPPAPTADFSIDSIASLADTVVQISWTEGSLEGSKYLVERKTGKADFSKIAETENTEKMYVDRTAKPAKLYAYRICQQSDSGEKSCTLGMQVKTLKKKKIAKPRLRGAVENGKVNLSWAPTYSSDFRVVISRKIGKKGKYRALTVAPADTSSFLDENVQAGTIYYQMVVSARKKSTQKSVAARVNIP